MELSTAKLRLVNLNFCSRSANFQRMIDEILRADVSQEVEPIDDGVMRELEIINYLTCSRLRRPQVNKPQQFFEGNFGLSEKATLILFT